MAPIIEAKGLGVEFYRSRRRHLQIRELLRKGSTGTKPGKFWALRDVDLSVQKGDAVGLMGANGCGKSTLLKMVAGVLLPDEGGVTVRGGVAPLIELTGGFVPDLTARDNIWLTAGLHGLTKSEIESRFDEIVEFAEVGEFLDTPFRHFSSGMKVRLGFSVITQLDEPIILVDEVLAVGDRRFREKCYKRLEQRLAEGRTLFLVSHNEADLLRFCTRGVYLRHGEVVEDGDVRSTVKAYNSDSDRGRA